MSRHDDEVRLRHMRDHAREAMALLVGKRREHLDRDRVLQLALVRLIEIVGEAANRVSEERRKSLPEVPWAQVIGMRNRLVHGYDDVSVPILWDTITDDLPSLLATLEAGVPSLSTQEGE